MKRRNMFKTSNLSLLVLFLLSMSVMATESEGDLCGINPGLLDFNPQPALSFNGTALESSPMLASVSTLKYSPTISLAPLQTTGTAEIYVQRLAERGRSKRTVSGVVGLISGGLFIGLGAAIGGDEELSEDDRSSASTAMYIAGAAMVGVGIFSLAVPSRAEREYKNIMLIDDPEARELAGHEALISMADDAKTARIIGGVICLGFGAYFLAARPLGSEDDDYYYYGTSTDYDWMNDVMAGTYGLVGLLSFVMKSEEEKTLERYQMAIADGNVLDFNFGLKKNGIGAKLVYNF